MHAYSTSHGPYDPGQRCCCVFMLVQIALQHAWHRLGLHAHQLVHFMPSRSSLPICMRLARSNMRRAFEPACTHFASLKDGCKVPFPPGHHILDLAFEFEVSNPGLVSHCARDRKRNGCSVTIF